MKSKFLIEKRKVKDHSKRREGKGKPDGEMGRGKPKWGGTILTKVILTSKKTQS